MTESATNVCFRNGSPSPLRLGALATALSVCTTAEKKGMFTLPTSNRGSLSWCSFDVSLGMRVGADRLPSPAVGSSLPTPAPLPACREQVPLPQAAAATLLVFSRNSSFL